MRTWLYLFLGVIYLVLGSLEAAAATRNLQALVIGNTYRNLPETYSNLPETYSNLPELKKPEADAQAVAAALSRRNFQTNELYNVTNDELLDEVERFAESLTPNSIAIVYFAGHGIFHDNSNLLLGFDSPDNEELINTKNTLSVIKIVELLNKNNTSGLKIVMIDACRTNPLDEGLPEDKIRKGLADISSDLEVFNDTIVSFAASPGRVAWEGDSKNPLSPYAEALVKGIGTDNLEIRSMLDRVKSDVSLATDKLQSPNHETSPFEFFEYTPFCFSNCSNRLGNIPLLGSIEDAFEDGNQAKIIELLNLDNSRTTPLRRLLNRYKTVEIAPLTSLDTVPAGARTTINFEIVLAQMDSQSRISTIPSPDWQYFSIDIFDTDGNGTWQVVNAEGGLFRSSEQSFPLDLYSPELRLGSDLVTALTNETLELNIAVTDNVDVKTVQFFLKTTDKKDGTLFEPKPAQRQASTFNFKASKINATREIKAGNIELYVVATDSHGNTTRYGSENSPVNFLILESGGITPGANAPTEKGNNFVKILTGAAVVTLIIAVGATGSSGGSGDSESTNSQPETPPTRPVTIITTPQ